MNPLRFLKDAAFRRWFMLWLLHRRRPRYQEGLLRAFGLELEVTDFISVVHQLRDIFVEHEYRIPPPARRPVIVDVGANVGVSVLYFCRNLADPEIHAFEADPALFAKLQRNVENNASDCHVHLIPAAAYVSSGTVSFLGDGSDAGRVAALDDDSSAITVESVDLLAYLRRLDYIDLLKIDIEGAESQVIPHCAPALGRVERLFIEYHSTPGQIQSLVRILSVLQDCGFRLHLQSADQVQSPFIPHPSRAFDNQVNIYAYRQ